jgi:hypothetical protein
VTVRVTETRSEQQLDQDGKPLRSGAYDLRLLRDGQLIAQWPPETAAEMLLSEPGQWRDLHRIDLSGGQFTHTFTNIPLPHSNTGRSVSFTAYAFNSDRVKSQTSEAREIAPLSAALRGRPPRRAYIIAMGVNANQSRWNLEFAVSSAQRVSKVVAAKLQSAYDEVVEIPLYSDLADDGPQIIVSNARKAQLKGVLDLLAGRPVDPSLREQVDGRHQLRAAEPDDAVVLYIASHGYVDRDENFHVVPFDTGSAWGITTQILDYCQSKQGGTGNCTSAIDFLRRTISSGDLTAWWRGIDAGQMIMILDTWYSGAVTGKDFRPAPLGDTGFGQLSYDKAMRVLCASPTGANRAWRVAERRRGPDAARRGTGTCSGREACREHRGMAERGAG